MNKQVKAETNGLAIASLVFGIIGILISWTVVLNLPFACMTFAFSLLSRGNKRKCGVAAAGTILGIVSIVIGIVVSVSLLRYAIQYVNSMMIDYDMLLEEIREFIQQFGTGGVL